MAKLKDKIRMTKMERLSFITELAALLNRHGIDANIDMSDHILAEYIMRSIDALGLVNRMSANWKELPEDEKI